MTEKTDLAAPFAVHQLRILLAKAREIADELKVVAANEPAHHQLGRLLSGLNKAELAVRKLGGGEPMPPPPCDAGKSFLLLELTHYELNMLQVLSAGLQVHWSPPDQDVVDIHWAPEKALKAFFERLNDGFHRPKSWEHAHVRAFFGDEWLDFMERDPEAPHRLRPIMKEPEET